MSDAIGLGEYAALSAKVKNLQGDTKLNFDFGDFTQPLAEVMPFDGIVIDNRYQRNLGWAGGGKRPFKIIDSTRGFDGFAEPEGYRRLGLWLMHLLLSERDWAGLQLTNATSRVTWFYVSMIRPMPRDPWLKQVGPILFQRYTYWPRKVGRHPFAELGAGGQERVDEEGRPFFCIGSSRDQAGWRVEAEEADQLILEATPEGIAAMACLLLDFAQPDPGTDEINMEPPWVGLAGTQPRSLEARFWRPGSFAFQEDSLRSLTLPPSPTA